MTLPTFDKLLRPILQIASTRQITRKDIYVDIAKLFNLTEKQLNERLKSGEPKVLNRCGWAMTFLTKAKLIEKVATRTYAITALGVQFLKDYPDNITVKDLSKVDGWEDSWNNIQNNSDDKNNKDKNQHSDPYSENTTPIEVLDNSIATIEKELKSRLLASILEQPPIFFENLVLDLLVAMGYGGNREQASEHLGRSGDEGIDGKINQDTLGLDQIFVQAKRYSPGNVIGRPAIQGFVGTMSGHGVSKGIFITTSSFADTALEFVQRGSQIKIVLIDGEQLLDLMLQHKIGVRTARQIDLLEIDQNYFNEDA